MIIKCPKCGTIASDRTATCPSCGEILNAEVYASEQKATEEVAVEAVEEVIEAAEVMEAAVAEEPEAKPEEPEVTPEEPEVKPAAEQTVEPEAPAPQAPQQAAVPQPEPKKRRSWKGFIWTTVAILALAGTLCLYTMAITRMGLDTIKIEVHFYTRPLQQDTTATEIAAVPTSDTQTVTE